MNIFWNVIHFCDAKLNLQHHYYSLQCHTILQKSLLIKYADLLLKNTSLLLLCFSSCRKKLCCYLICVCKPSIKCYTGQIRFLEMDTQIWFQNDLGTSTTTGIGHNTFFPLYKHFAYLSVQWLSKLLCVVLQLACIVCPLHSQAKFPWGSLTYSSTWA